MNKNKEQQNLGREEVSGEEKWKFTADERREGW